MCSGIGTPARRGANKDTHGECGAAANAGCGVAGCLFSDEKGWLACGFLSGFWLRAAFCFRTARLAQLLQNCNHRVFAGRCEGMQMKVLDKKMGVVSGIVLLAAVTLASPPVLSKAERDQMAGRIDALERAANNREVAARTQLAYASYLQKQAQALDADVALQEGLSETQVARKIADHEKRAAALCGSAAANFDMAVSNLTRVVQLGSRRGRDEGARAARDRAAQLKQQADRAIELAGIASENAALAYDRARDGVEAATASQQAAVWLEKLATR